MSLAFNLGGYLHAQQLTVNQLVREVKGRVSSSTVYGLARRRTRRLDLEIIGRILDGLSRLQGRTVILTDLLDSEDVE